MHQRIDNALEFGRFLVRRFLSDQGPHSAAALTYTTLFAQTKVKTPRYDYNQVMYRLDLDDPRLKMK